MARPGDFPRGWHGRAGVPSCDKIVGITRRTCRELQDDCCFSWLTQHLSKLTCQIQLIKHQGNQPTPQLKLCRGAYMNTRPEQILLEKPIAMLLREASTLDVSNLRQRDHLIEHHKPTHTWIPFRAFRCFSLDADHTEVQVTVLLEMQMVPSAGAYLPVRSCSTANSFSLCMGLGAFALKQRTIFRLASTRVDAYWNTIELPIAFEPDQHAIAQFMARTQELRSPIPPIRQNCLFPKSGLSACS